MITSVSRPLHIGIIAGSVEGAALCYRTIVLESEQYLGEYDHPRITLDNLPLAEYSRALGSDDLQSVAALLQRSLAALSLAGADFAICPDNTFHVALPSLEAQAIPLIGIIDVVADEARERGYRRVGVLGTRITMESTLYSHALGRLGIEAVTPDAQERAVVDGLLQQELVKGRFTNEAREVFQAVIGSLAARGCDAVALACTEIPLLISPTDSALPTLDSRALLFSLT